MRATTCRSSRAQAGPGCACASRSPADSGRALVTNIRDLSPASAWQARGRRCRISILFDIGAPIADEPTTRRVARTQTHMRRVNEAMCGDGRIVVRCECGRLGCNALLEIARDEYEAIRAHPLRFAIVPDHAAPEIDATVERRGPYDIVQAHHPIAIALAEATSRGRPRD